MSSERLDCRWHHIPCGHDLGPPAPTGKFVYNLYTNWQANMSSERLDCRWHHIPCGHDLGPPAPTGKFVYNLYTNWQANMSSKRLDCRWHHIPCGPDLGPPAPTGKFVYNLYTNWEANMSSKRLDCRWHHIPCGHDLGPPAPTGNGKQICQVTGEIAGGITSLVAMIWARPPRQGNLCTICTPSDRRDCRWHHIPCGHDLWPARPDWEICVQFVHKLGSKYVK